MSQDDWQKSTFSPDGSNCLNVSATCDGTIKVRESDQPNTIFATTPETLRAFILSIRSGY
ncbi:DUF397 domain-containing protein [Streptomyces sp. NPDC051320]|uniref:DUF397 domain-containing protein n=1 Tax=Streptomyces sp. NPDC051320 TaxID=3154644 RepID=UPI003438E1EE